MDRERKREKAKKKIKGYKRTVSKQANSEESHSIAPWWLLPFPNSHHEYTLIIPFSSAGQVEGGRCEHHQQRVTQEEDAQLGASQGKIIIYRSSSNPHQSNTFPIKENNYLSFVLAGSSRIYCYCCERVSQSQLGCFGLLYYNTRESLCFRRKYKKDIILSTL